MKKSFALVGLAAMMLAACGGNAASGTTESATVSTDESEITATLTKDAEGKLTAVNIDEVKEGESKKDAGDDYSMKKLPPSVKNGMNRLNSWKTTFWKTV